MADLEFGVDINFDVGQIRRATERIADVLERVTARTTDLAGGFQKVEDRGERAFRNVGQAAAGAVRDFNRLNDPVEELRDDLAAVEQRANATRETLERVGANPQLFATAKRELERMVKLQAEINNRQEQIANDPGLAQVYRTRFEAIRTELSKDISNINELLRSTARERGQIQARENAILKDQIQERADIRRRARGVEVAQIQTESAQLVQARRAQANAAIQQSQRQARVRIELLRFTFRQAQTLERAIGRVFAGAATVIQGAYARIENTVFRIGRVFRRSNRQLDDGLAPALRAREGALARSFSRQNTVVQSSLTRQERTIQAFNARLSSGVAGAATGRSGLGALLGGGLAFGGGFVLLNKLKAGFDEAVDLNEALNKTREIFGDAAGDIEAFTQNSVEALFITQSVALEGAANFGIFGKAAGLAGEDLSDFSIELLSLATDLASFNNTTVDDAIVSLSAALRGESEPIRRYGVLLNQAVLQQRALSEGIIQEIRVLTPAERVLAAYAEILAQTTDAQGDAARTADDFANSSRRAAAASVETFAAIAENLIPIAEIITNAALPSFQGLTAFIRDEVGPVLSAVRDGLIGASAALAGLLAARIAGEAVSFLAIALRAASSPLGLFVTAVAGIGAAVNILRLRIPEVQVALERFGQIARDVLGAGLDLALEGFNLLVDFIVEVGLPALRDLASFVGTQLRRALEVSFNFIATTVVPILVRFANFVTGTVVPAVEELAGIIVDGAVAGFELLRSAAETVLTVVEPLVRPAIEGFRELGEVIAGAFTGDASFQDILSGLDGAISGIGATFANIGVAIYDALRPQVERAVRFIADAFRNIDYASIGIAILQVVRTVGRVIGTIVSSPEFVTAVAAIAAAAVAVGGAFVVGLGEGIVSNLDDLGSLLGDAVVFGLEEALDFALSDPARFARIIAAGLAVAFLASRVLAVWATAGQRGAQELARGFLRGVRSSPAITRQIASGLFGRGGLQSVVDGQAAQARRALVSQFQRANRDLRRLGLDLPAVGTRITEESVRDLNNRLGEAEGAFGRAGVAARLFRERSREVFRGVGEIARGTFEGLSRNSQTNFSKVRTGLARIQLVAADSFARFQASGRSLGIAAGDAVLAGFGAVLGGQALGRGNTTLGLAGILASSLAAGLATGSPIVAGAVAGIGLITAAFESNKRAAEEAAERVDDYKDILGEFRTAAESVPDVSVRLAGVLVESNLDFAEDLVDLGVTVDDIAAQIADGSFDAADAVRVLGEALNFPDADIRFLQENLGALGEIPAVGKVAARNLDDTGLSLREFIDLIELLAQEGQGAATALREVGAATGLVGRRPGGAEPGSIFADFPPPEETALAQYGPFIEEIGRGNIQAPNPFQNLLDEFLPNLTFEVDAVAEAIESLNDIRTSELNAQIDEASGRLSSAREAARLAREALTEYFTSNYTNGAQNAVDNVINSIGSVGSAIAEALELGGEARSESALGAATAGFAASIATAIQEGFDAGLDVEGITASLAPIRQAIQEAVDAEDISQGAADQLNRVLDDALDDEALTAGIEFVTEAEAEVAAIQAELDRLNAELDVTLRFDPGEVLAQIQALGLQTDLTPEDFERRIEILQTPPTVTDPREADFLAEAQALARAAAAPPEQNVDQTINETTNITIEAPITIQGGAPIPTASETVSELVSVSASALGSYSSPTRRRSPVRVATNSPGPI